ncbi:MAG: sigma factor-like helix-turn-helix DNA-binding protein [Thermovirgaceae bacterium]|nr:sigma factor-like helix-turn-helix DNA-binding protein [Synergistales bacterium]MDI9393365.1 sigma factor-like helix-turn-helix DNA-binding protein [Synergistota bacterium]MDY0178896.1 sigma factor-like helix-turn-helix DNA-binding protein [Synergistaceae bacterium]HRW87665.1 sigma factor-like helix-turn-helix DNA-binding protein [Thermovirgaceae bacterium]MDD3134057.1 sigma factor-like helix-turn-helix DNA-binding protein [Synergistales bacterium]
MKDQIEHRVMLSRLFDFYEPVLTEKQREAFRLHVLEDWSLSEVAERLEVTRQGAHDLVQRGRDRLLEMEGLLGFSAKDAKWERHFRELGRWYQRHMEKISQEAAAELAVLLAPEEREG